MTKALRKKLRKLQKLQHRLKVTFERDSDTDAVLVAMIGQGYAVSSKETGLSDGQVAYRMKLAREIYKRLPAPAVCPCAAGTGRA